MHERNPYGRPPDFARLCAVHAELRPHCKLIANGKVHLDFTDDAAVRALTRALLKEDFALDVELPSGSLCPRVPQRLNYLLWIEDAILASGRNADAIRGIDIGTGASCIYALLGARRFGWSFVATEAESSSAEAARRNVERNGLVERVEVVKTDGDGPLIEGVVTSSSTGFSFCMCNPPFFDGDGDTAERFVGRGEREWENGGVQTGGKRSAPRSGTIASENELATEGGEVAFIGRLIEESARLREKVKLYTTMLGKKSSVARLAARLAKKAEEEKSLRFTTGELRQGRTQRWLLAWTYAEDVKLPMRPASLELVVKERTRDQAMPWIREQLSALRVDILREEEGADDEGRLECRVTAPTWLRRRRKGKKGGEETENEDAPFAPFPLSLSLRDTRPSVTLVFTIDDEARKRELSQLVVHLSNKLIVNSKGSV
ncbi:hypothetical protein PMAYCL1PPCAC_14691 [Pristionchus mayeri]|uniref:U6 small nuclear RNA (adenine-(43)-N(6))-methyltransferase n=1 Tax=Pristionchus mayeri TaxID=1317129 RepID=A0AAN5CHI9_9BILA|nr:hypothetical protein PMAYCL1PPCAC_14691 [Pristionchus mayeri]